MRLWYRLLLCVISAALCFFAFTGYDHWYFALISWVPMFIATDDLSLKRTFLLAWFFGTVAHFAGYYWLPQTIITFGEFPRPLACLIALILNAYQGMAFAIIATLRNGLKKRGHDSIFLAAAAFAAVEQIYPRLFPIHWGNTFYKVLVAVQSVDLFGVIFISFMIILVNLAVTNLIQVYILNKSRLQLKGIIIVVALWAANLIYGGVRMAGVRSEMEKAEKIKIGVIQGNLTMFSKKNTPRDGLLLHREMSIDIEEKGIELFVWSESAVNYSIPAEMKTLKNAILGEVATPTIFGAIRIEKEDGKEREFNTAFLVDGDGKVLGYYDKRYLLAFGEYIPFGETFPKLYEWSPNTGQFSRGTSLAPVKLENHNLGILICYEDILPDLVRKMVAASNNEIDMLINITNDSWFGDTAEPWIHLGLSTFRSIEHRRWMIRSTNSGVSAAIDPVGRIVKTSSVMKEDSFIIEAGFMKGRTLYQVFGRLFGYFCIGAVIGFFIRRRKESEKPDRKNAGKPPSSKKKFIKKKKKRK